MCVCVCACVCACVCVCVRACVRACVCSENTGRSGELECCIECEIEKILRGNDDEWCVYIERAGVGVLHRQNGLEI